MEERRSTDRRNIWIAVAVVTGAMALVWPFAKLSYGDDTAFSHVALVLARTGHFAYNCWESMLLVGHAAWGALFIRAFGFSFDCLRLSTLPFALGSVALTYVLTKRMGLSSEKAFFVTMLLGLSPLFLPVAVSYMTDVPSLFFTFASFYLFVRAAEASSDGKALGWIVFGSVVGYLGGLNRQSVWFAPLVLLPHLAWLRRKRWIGIAAAVSWILVVVGVVLTTAWFNSQPYVYFQPSLTGEIVKAIHNPVKQVDLVARLLLMLVLLCLPAALPLLVKSTSETIVGSWLRKLLVLVPLFAVIAAVVIHPSLASIPWASNTLNWEGIFGAAPLPGRPIVLIRPVRAVVAMIIYIAVCLLAGELTRFRESMQRAWTILLDRDGSHFSLASMTQLNAVYFTLFVIRGVDFDLFDRYLIPIIPWVATIFLLWLGSDEQSETIWRKSKPFAWALLIVLGSYGVANTQDMWALARARVTAAEKLESAGVSRTEIDAAFEYNGWTQLMATGRLNSHWVKNPPNAYVPGETETPVVVPKYRLEYELTPETEPSEYSSVPYFSFLPPYGKAVRIDRIKKLESKR